MPEVFSEFWDFVVKIWTDGIFGVNLSEVFIALGIIAFALILRSLFTKLVMLQLKQLTKKSETEFDDKLIEALDGPIRFIPIVIGVFVATQLMTLSDETRGFSDAMNESLVLFNIFWAMQRALGPLSFVLGVAKGILPQGAVDWLVKILKALIIALGAAAIFESWGIQVAPLLAGLGIFGVAVALGAQNVFKNLIAGFFVISEGRFEHGDWILVDGVVEGTVEDIGFRTTLIRRFDKAPVYVPNSELSDNAVTNFTRMTHRRIYWKIGLEYRTTVEQLKEVVSDIMDYILASDEFAHPPEVSTFVHVDAFNDSSIDIMIYCFTITTDWGAWLEIKERFALEIKGIVEGRGAGFAFPSQSIYVEMLPEAAPHAGAAS